MLRDAREYRWHLTGLVVLCLLTAPLALLTPLPIKIAVDNVIGNENLPQAIVAIFPQQVVDSKSLLMFAVVGMIILFTLLQQTRALFASLLETYTAEHLVLRMRDTARTEGFDYSYDEVVELEPEQNLVVDFRAESGGFILR